MASRVPESPTGQSPHRSDENEPLGRPVGLRFLTGFLLASPLVHGIALALGRQWASYGSPRLWDGIVHVAVAPLVGVLMLRRHDRARFAVYLFLSCELFRAIRLPSVTLALLSLAALLYLQLPGPRRIHPPIDPDRVLQRIGWRRKSGP